MSRGQRRAGWELERRTRSEETRDLFGEGRGGWPGGAEGIHKEPRPPSERSAPRPEESLQRWGWGAGMGVVEGQAERRKRETRAAGREPEWDPPQLQGG